MSRKTSRTALPTIGALAAGAAGAYFLDPATGKRRRHVFRDRALAMVRRPAEKAARETERKASYAQGVAKGAVHEATTSGDQRDPDRLNDPALGAKVETEIFRDPEAPKGSVIVNVEEGIVFLRGKVGSSEGMSEIVAAAEAVDGVGEVRNLLHLPGEPAPDKESAGQNA